MNAGKAVLGAMAGLAVGGILGILFAPEKGSVTRRKIADKSNDYVNDLKSKYDDFAGTLKEKFHAAKNGAHDLVDNENIKFTDVKNDISDAIY